MASHDRSDIAARDVEVCRAAVLPLRARRTTGEAEERRVPDVDRLRGTVGLGSTGRLAAVTRVSSVKIARRSVSRALDDRDVRRAECPPDGGALC
jgi:hypothetical protein